MGWIFLLQDYSYTLILDQCWHQKIFSSATFGHPLGSLSPYFLYLRDLSVFSFTFKVHLAALLTQPNRLGKHLSVLWACGPPAWNTLLLHVSRAPSAAGPRSSPALPARLPHSLGQHGPLYTRLSSLTGPWLLEPIHLCVSPGHGSNESLYDDNYSRSQH